MGSTKQQNTNHRKQTVRVNRQESV